MDDFHNIYGESTGNRALFLVCFHQRHGSAGDRRPGTPARQFPPRGKIDSSPARSLADSIVPARSKYSCRGTAILHRIILALITLLALRPLQAQAPPIPRLLPEVLNVYPHDADAFTQGLLWHEGYLYESTGLYGASTLRRVDIESGEALELLTLDELYFAEGLERVGNRLIQLTWKAGRAFVYDFASFELIDAIEYDGEGWGLCYDGRYLFMSDGSPFLSIRDPQSFALIFRGAVTWEGQLLPAQLLNELECVGDAVYANAWNTDYIFRIDKYTGVVTALVDASALLTEAERAALRPGSVLNGIAYNPEADTFFITGKNWPKLFEVVFTEP